MKALLITALSLFATLLFGAKDAIAVPFNAYCQVHAYGQQDSCSVQKNENGYAVIEARAVGNVWLDKISSESQMTIAIRNETGNVGIAMLGNGYANDQFFASGTGSATTWWTDEVKVKDSILPFGASKTLTFHHNLHFKTGANGGGSPSHQSSSTMSIKSHFDIREGWNSLDPSKLDDTFSVEGPITDKTLAHTFTITTTVGSTLFFGYQMDTTLRYQLEAPSANYPFRSHYSTVLDAYNSAHIYAWGDATTILESLSGHDYSMPAVGEVPEPSSFALMGLAMAGLAFSRRHKS